MRRLLLLFIIVFVFFISPTVLIGSHNIVYARAGDCSKDWVDGDFPCGMDAAKLGDVNVVGSLGAAISIFEANVVRQFVGGVPKVTTNSTDVVYLQQMYKESFVYGAESVVTYVYTNPPASTYAFVRDMGESLGFIPQSVNAQGIGFSGLSQLLPMWKAFRNIAYLLLAIFMIVIGFLIMFRKKIDPKTVITVQNAIPNIVITLLLITFSYAIVGVLIDFMYLLIMLSVSILQPISNGAISAETAKTFISSDFTLIVQKLWLGGDTWLTSKIPMWEALNDIASMLGPWGVGVGVGVPATVGILGFLISNSPLAAAAPLLLIVLIVLAFVIAIIKLLFLLGGAYIQIILSLLVSPFQILMGVFPGSHAFENWIKNLVANLAVFPITAIMLLVGTILVKADYSGSTLWGPPFLTPAGTGIFGGGMGGIIGLGTLFAIPSVAGSIKEALKAKPMVAAGPGAVVGPLGTAGGQLLNYAYQISMVKNLLQKKEQPNKPS